MNVNVNVGVRVTVSARVSVTGIARARRDLSNAVDRAQIHAGLSKSMWRPRAARGPGAGRFVRNLAHRPLRVVLLVQANRKDTLARNLAQAAESTL